MPSADLISVAVSRGQDGVVCVSYRLAGDVRLGSESAFIARQRAPDGSRLESRYEVQLAPSGKISVSRPHGEPRYAVRADVVRRGDTLTVVMQTLLSPAEGFDWRGEVRYLPRFPLGDAYLDVAPDEPSWEYAN